MTSGEKGDAERVPSDESTAINEPKDSARTARARVAAGVRCSGMLGAGNAGVELRNDVRDGALLCSPGRQQRETRETAVVAAQVHGIFQSGNTVFRDDTLRRLHQEKMQA